MFLLRQTKPGENYKFSPSQIKLTMVTWSFPFQVSINLGMFLPEKRSDQLPMSGNDPDCSHTKNQVQSQGESRAGAWSVVCPLSHTKHQPIKVNVSLSLCASREATKVETHQLLSG